MRKIKTYTLVEPLSISDVKFNKRTLAVLETLKESPKTAKEIQASLNKYTTGGIGAALSELRKAGLLVE